MTALRITADSQGDPDIYGRGQAAQSLVDTMLAVDVSKGSVLGLQGTWGSGKSWLLHEAKRRVDKMPSDPRPLWVEFSPWALSGSDALVEALINEIAGQIKLEKSVGEKVNEATELGDRLLEYATHLGAIRHLALPAGYISPALGAAVAKVGYGADIVAGAAKDARPLWKRLATAIQAKYPPPPPGRPALLDLRARVVEALEKLDRTLIVVLDDLDRMTPQEVADIVQTRP